MIRDLSEDRHLSEEEISAVVAGDKNPESAAHLEHCAHCRQQLEQFEDVIGAFRGAVREWSDVQFGGAVAPGSRTRIRPALARACGFALIILLSVIGYRFSSMPVRNAGDSFSKVSVDSDALLLDHVKDDVSRSAPPGMETLLGFTPVGFTSRTTQR